jgi:hypothetical protein
MLSTKFQFIWESGFRREEFKKSANQKQESPDKDCSFHPDSLANMAAIGNSCFRLVDS